IRGGCRRSSQNAFRLFLPCLPCPEVAPLLLRLHLLLLLAARRVRSARALARRLRRTARAAAFRDDRRPALVVGEQPAVAGVRNRNVRLGPQPVVLEDRRLAA